MSTKAYGMLASLLFLLATPSSSLAGPVLSGRYVLTQRTVVVADIPILPDLSTETWSVGLLDLVHGSDRLQGRGKLCSIEMQTSSSLVRTELPRAFQRLLSDVQLDARLTQRESDMVLEESARVLVLGATLRDPERDPLPKEAADPRVVDQDGDGHPGVTVRVRGIVNGEVYVVQRGKAALFGKSEPLGFRGNVTFQSEDVVVGATRPALMRRTKARPDLERSTFVLRRVGAETSCTEAIAVARRVHF
jgi:hypothetical protein